MKTKVKTIFFAPTRRSWNKIEKRLARYPGNYDLVTAYGFTIKYRHPQEPSTMHRTGLFVASPAIHRSYAIMREMHRMPLPFLKGTFENFREAKEIMVRTDRGRVMAEVLEGFMIERIGLMEGQQLKADLLMSGKIELVEHKNANGSTSVNMQLIAEPREALVLPAVSMDDSVA